MDTDNATRFFDRLRPRLQGIAYRMLGSRAEAEELVQDVWLRWHEADGDGLDNAEAWLVTVTTRLAIDRLRSAKVQRAHYVGFWLPEPWLEQQQQQQQQDGPVTPEQQLERADDISVAFLALLERLSPEARAAFLLREVFDADYAEVAQALGKTEAACRQIVSRAKVQLKDHRPRQAVSPDTHYRLLAGFAEAARKGDFAGLQALLAEDAELISDGGGIVPSFGKALAGAARIAQLYFAVWRRSELGLARQRLELVRLNGQWGLLRFIDGRLESAQSLETDGMHITRIQTQRNPEKLRHLSEAWAAAPVTKGQAASSGVSTRSLIHHLKPRSLLMSQQGLNYAQHAPEQFKKFLDFGLSLKKSALGNTLQDLITLRASQLNGCAFCVDMHVKEATLHGERALRLHHVAVWHESPLFSPRERAALAWTEALTQLPSHGVPESAFTAVREHFSEAEVAELSFAIVAINGWNRLAIGFAAVPGSQDKAYGLDKAGLN